MRITDIIEKKKHGGALSKEEITFFVNDYVENKIPDYQIAALLMAIWFRGMTKEETFHLTMAMKYSGDVLNLNGLEHTIDKHSTGGIGDKLSLIVMPLWHSGGLTIAKMSGRGLGFTGGTIDKLEAIPGYNASLDKTSFLETVQKNGIAITGQSASLVPADKKLYALRDVTATVDSLPLIAASIMSKKLATAAQNIVLDVKYGEGSFMKTREDARKLAELMIDLGKNDGRRMAALLSPMNRPLGYAVGNALEVKEAYEFLCKEQKEKSALAENALALAGVGFILDGKTETLSEGIMLCHQLICSGKAKQSFFRWLKGQGGIFDENNFPGALHYPTGEFSVIARKSGIVTDINALSIGTAGMEMGAGRKQLEDKIDPAAGVILKKNIGDTVSKGDVLAILYGQNRSEEAERLVSEAFILGNKTPIKEEIEVFWGNQWEIIK